MNAYLNQWLTIIEQMNNDNTYKLAWGRALLECIHNNIYSTNAQNLVVIDFHDIAKYMVKYYWNQSFFFNLKQSANQKKPPVIWQETVKLINEYKAISKSSIPIWHDEGLNLILSNNPNLYHQCIEHVVKTLHENVCWRFKYVQGKVLEIYIYDKKLGSYVFFKPEDIQILKDYDVIIAKLLNYKWAQLLEKFNFAPKIVNKVNGISESKLRRNSLSKYKEILLMQFKDGEILDFYTETPLDIHDISVDHVIPWSFMYSDDIWNLVLTSKSNNSSKSNSIPSEETIEKLKERNKYLLDVLEGKFKEDVEIAIEHGYLDKFYYECKL